MTLSNDLKSRVLNCRKSKEYTDTEIIRIYKISRDTFYKWIRDDKNKYTSKSRKYKITYPIKSYIIKYVTTKVNFAYKKLIDNIERKFNTKVSKTTIYNILKTNKIKRKRLYQKEIQTAQSKRNEQIKFFKEQLKNVPINNIISIDETSIDTHLHHNYGWSKTGKKVSITKTYKRIRYTAICAISSKQVIHTKIILGSANAIIFLEFIKKVFKKLQLDENYIILDNARIHHAKILKAYVKKIKNIKLVYNVPYSPELNPIELLFNELKTYLRNEGINNNDTINKINKAFQNVKRNNLKQYFKKALSFYQ